MIDRRTIHVDDLQAEAEEYPVGATYARNFGHRTTLVTPLMREGVPLGALMVRRHEVRPFTDKQIELLETFAAQAVIAIENARLFQELQARTRDLARSVEQLQALGAVGQAVSSTLDIETVLTTIVSRADLLAGADGGAIYEYDEADRRSFTSARPSGSARSSSAPPTPSRSGWGRARSAGRPRPASRSRSPTSWPRGPTRGGCARSSAGRISAPSSRVPLVREGRILGGLVVLRKTPGRFAPEVVDLLKTLAAQSAIAIQNARLFQDLEDKSQELEAASRHKSEFLANMSHELRTPLNAIIGFSEVLGERMFGELNEKQAEYVEDILSSGRHLLALINDILDLSKVEAGRMELELSRFDLPAAIGGAVILVRERATRHGLALEVSVDDRLGPFVGDERKIRQVLLNLLSNAVKFTPEGGRIGVRAGPGRRRRRDLGVRHGDRDRARGPGGDLPGVPPGRHRLRAEARGHGPRPGPRPAVRRSPRGTDLGEEPAGRGLDLHLHDPGEAMAGELILIVEDNEKNRKLVRDVLQFKGYRTLDAETGEIGLRLARETLPALVLMDIQLPGMSGIDALGHLRADPATRHIPVDRGHGVGDDAGPAEDPGGRLRRATSRSPST